MTDKRVVIIGSGVAGLSTAVKLADLGVGVDMVERSAFPGGHAATYTCKATDQCVKCGACMVDDKLCRAVDHSDIRVWTGTQVKDVSRHERFTVNFSRRPVFIDPEKCHNCGECLAICPEPNAVTTGFSRSHKPYYAISPEKCRYVKDRSCSLCITACEMGAIDLDREATAWAATADAVVLAAGFAPFSPEVKPYGYGVFDNVITHLGMEQILRDHAAALRPSDGRQAGRIAFIQCVGSRDAKLGHLWCSRVCCGSALRMAGLVLADAPETDITFYYMDVQTFGRDFDDYYATMRDQVRMIRSIPGDIYPAENDTLRVTFLDATTSETRQEDFDLVVLSVAMVPVSDLKDTCRMLDVKLADTGFAAISDTEKTDGASGVFIAGAVTGPMSIAESIASGGKTAWDIAKYLGLAP